MRELGVPTFAAIGRSLVSLTNVTAAMNHDDRISVLLKAWLVCSPNAGAEETATPAMAVAANSVSVVLFLTKFFQP